LSADSKSRAAATSSARTYRVTFAGDGSVKLHAEGKRREQTARVLINDESIAQEFAAPLDPEQADLIDVAVAAYIADRLCKRGTQALTWSRSLSVVIPVRREAHWRRLEGDLRRILEYLTGDSWAFHFTKRTADPRESESQTTLFRETARQPSGAILFSGGLDSLAGLAAMLASGSYADVVAISILTNTRIGAPQLACVQALEKRFPEHIRHLSVRIRVEGRSKKAFDSEEHSQRTRGFLFQSIGAVSALSAGLSTLAIPENGLGAINLPYLESQFGTQAGRAANPMTLALMSAFITKLTDKPFTLSLPHLLQTKGELLGVLAEQGLGGAAASTVSCDSFPLRHHTELQCGTCTSCLLRRQSMRCARLSQWDGTEAYKRNVFAMRSNLQQGAWFELRAMNDQVIRLEAAVRSSDPASSLISVFPSLAELFALLRAQGRDTDIDATVDLYRRYCAEWRDFEQAYAKAS